MSGRLTANLAGRTLWWFKQGLFWDRLIRVQKYVRIHGIVMRVASSRLRPRPIGHVDRYDVLRGRYCAASHRLVNVFWNPFRCEPQTKAWAVG